MITVALNLFPIPRRLCCSIVFLLIFYRPYQRVVWDGQGNPYSFHLHHVVRVCLPYLVEALYQLCPAPGPLLVGASAWNAYLDMPFDTTDLDFMIVLHNETGQHAHVFQDLLLQVVAAAGVHPHVQHSLAVLDVSNNRVFVSKNWKGRCKVGR